MGRVFSAPNYLQQKRENVALDRVIILLEFASHVWACSGVA